MLELSLVPEPLRESVFRHWQRFEEAIARDALGEPQQWLSGQVSTEEFFRQLSRAFTGSEFIAKTCALEPQILFDLVTSGDLFKPLSDEGYKDLVAAAIASQSDAELDRVLRRERRKVMVRIIWRDFNRTASMSETTAELSRFADTAIQQAAAFHYRQLVAQYGFPQGKYSGLSQPFVVLGMGKLGACELNVSSDIDLIFTYPEAGNTD